MSFCTHCGAPTGAEERDHARDCKSPPIVAFRALYDAVKRVHDVTGVSLYTARDLIVKVVTATNTPTLRDQFAMAALSGAHPVNKVDAAHAYKVADMMLAAREPPDHNRNTK